MMSGLATGGRIRRTLGIAPLLLALGLALGGCDSEDNDWEQPTDPGGDPDPQLSPELILSVDFESIGDQVRSGDPVQYTVRLENDGDGTATAIEVAVTAPAEMSLDQVLADPGAWDPESGVWSLDELAAKQEAALAIAATVADDVAGLELTLTAAVQAVQPADAMPDENLASVRFTVVAGPPQAGDDAWAVDEGATLDVPAPGLLENDLDLDGEEIAVQTEPVEDPRHGVVTLAADGSFRYVHDGGEAAADSFRYRIEDTSAEADTATVRITIAPVNDPPLLTVPGVYSVLEGAVFAPIPLDPLVADPDDPDAELEWQIQGSDVLVFTIDSDRVLTVTTPGPDWFGFDAVTVRVRDPDGEAATANVRFEVASVNDPPVVSPLPNQSVPVGGAFLPVPLDNYVADVDHDDDELDWTVTGAGSLVVTIDDERVLTVQPPHDAWTGSVTLTLRATDPLGAWAERTCRYEITPSR